MLRQDLIHALRCSHCVRSLLHATYVLSCNTLNSAIGLHERVTLIILDFTFNFALGRIER